MCVLIRYNSLRPSDGDMTIIGSDNGLSPGRRQALIWTNAELLLNGPIGTNFREFWIKFLTFSFKKMRLKVSSSCRPLDVAIVLLPTVYRKLWSWIKNCINLTEAYWRICASTIGTVIDYSNVMSLVWRYYLNRWWFIISEWLENTLAASICSHFDEIFI